MVVSIPTLAVSAIFCIWHAYRGALWRQKRLLHERVAYMLWVVAMGDVAD
jgi:hypothetical protein